MARKTCFSLNIPLFSSFFLNCDNSLPPWTIVVFEGLSPSQAPFLLCIPSSSPCTRVSRAFSICTPALHWWFPNCGPHTSSISTTWQLGSSASFPAPLETHRIRNTGDEIRWPVTYDLPGDSDDCLNLRTSALGKPVLALTSSHCLGVPLSSPLTSTSFQAAHHTGRCAL